MQVKALVVLAWLGAPAEADPCRAGSVTGAELDGSRVVVCFGERHEHTCAALDLGTLAWAKAKALPENGSRPTAPRITSSAVVTACAPDGSACHTVVTPLAVGLEVISEGPLVTVVEDERLTVVGASAGKVEATIVPWPHPENQRGWSFRNVRFVGPEQLFVELGDGDTVLARVFTARTGATALELPELDRLPPITFGNELVLAAAGGTDLVFGDVKRRARRSIPLFASPATLQLLAATTKVIVAVQDRSDGTVAVSDGKTTKLVPGPPVCP